MAVGEDGGVLAGREDMEMEGDDTPTQHPAAREEDLVWIVEVLLDDFGVWNEERQQWLRRTERWGAVDVTTLDTGSVMIVDAYQHEDVVGTEGGEDVAGSDTEEAHDDREGTFHKTGTTSWPGPSPYSEEERRDIGRDREEEEHAEGILRSVEDSERIRPGDQVTHEDGAGPGPEFGGKHPEKETCLDPEEPELGRRRLFEMLQPRYEEYVHRMESTGRTGDVCTIKQFAVYHLASALEGERHPNGSSAEQNGTPSEDKTNHQQDGENQQQERIDGGEQVRRKQSLAESRAYTAAVDRCTVDDNDHEEGKEHVGTMQRAGSVHHSLAAQEEPVGHPDFTNDTDEDMSEGNDFSAYSEVRDEIMAPWAEYTHQTDQAGAANEAINYDEYVRDVYGRPHGGGQSGYHDEEGGYEHTMLAAERASQHEAMGYQDPRLTFHDDWTYLSNQTTSVSESYPPPSMSGYAQETGYPSVHPSRADLPEHAQDDLDPSWSEHHHLMTGAGCAHEAMSFEEYRDDVLSADGRYPNGHWGSGAEEPQFDYWDRALAETYELREQYRIGTARYMRELEYEFRRYRAGWEGSVEPEEVGGWEAGERFEEDTGRLVVDVEGEEGGEGERGWGGGDAGVGEDVRVDGEGRVEELGGREEGEENDGEEGEEDAGEDEEAEHGEAKKEDAGLENQGKDGQDKKSVAVEEEDERLESDSGLSVLSRTPPQTPSRSPRPEREIPDSQDDSADE